MKLPKKIGADDDLKSTMTASLHTGGGGGGRDSCFPPLFSLPFAGGKKRRTSSQRSLLGRGGKGEGNFCSSFPRGRDSTKLIARNQTSNKKNNLFQSGGGINKGISAPAKKVCFGEIWRKLLSYSAYALLPPPLQWQEARSLGKRGRGRGKRFASMEARQEPQVN